MDISYPKLKDLLQTREIAELDAEHFYVVLYDDRKVSREEVYKVQEALTTAGISAHLVNTIPGGMEIFEVTR